MITTPTISHRQDEQDIRKIFADLVDVWNRHDMNAWSPLFTDDADFVNIGGAHLKGRGEIVKHHAALHAAHYKDSYITATTLDVRFLCADVAIAHLGTKLIFNNSADMREAYALGS